MGAAAWKAGLPIIPARNEEFLKFVYGKEVADAFRRKGISPDTKEIDQQYQRGWGSASDKDFFDKEKESRDFSESERNRPLYKTGDYQVKQRGDNDFVVTDKEGNVLSHFGPDGKSDTFSDIQRAKKHAGLRAKADKEAKNKKPPDPEQLKKLEEMAEAEKNAYNDAIIELFRNGMMSEKEAVGKITNRKNPNKKTITEARKLLGLEKHRIDDGLFRKSDFDKLKEKYRSAKSVTGDEDEIAVGNETISGKWKLVEADTPAASHDERTFHKTPGFPANDDGSTINDRDYERDRAAQEAVMEIAAGYDMRALSFDSPVAVTKDGIVISGNNRTMSSKIAARRGTDGKYIEALKKKAGKFGFTAEQISEFRHPRVVFELDHNEGYSTEQFAKFNESGKKAMSPIESAVKVSKMIKTKTVESIAGKIAEFETLGELYANRRAVQDIFNTLQQDGIIGQFDRPQYCTDDGITGAGKEFLETVLIGSVINEQNIRGLNREGCKSIRQKLVRAITPLIENKGMDGYSISKELNQAVDIAMQVVIQKDKFKDIADFSKQRAMFETLDPVAVEFARKLEDTQKGFAEFMQTMNGGLKYAASGEADIFLGGVESREDILGRMLNLKKAVRNVIDFFKGLDLFKGGFVKKAVPVFNDSGAVAYDDRWMPESGELPLGKSAAKPAADGSDAVIFDVALDFDGVINSYKSGWQGAGKTDEPVDGAAEAINDLLDNGLKIVIYSIRAETKEGEETIRNYLQKLIGDRADEIMISSGKPAASVYVDDRAINFNGDWEAIPGQIEKFRSWVEKSLRKSLTWSGYPLQGRTKVHGMDISIENRKGSTRSGVDKDGHEWHTKMNFDYGYIRGTVGKDKDHLDAYIGPDPEAETVYVVHQNNPVTGEYDEDKVMLGFGSEAEARKAYLSQYNRPGFLGSIDGMDIDTFKERAFNPKNKGKRLPCSQEAGRLNCGSAERI
jgi:hypothetical protein